MTAPRLTPARVPCTCTDPTSERGCPLAGSGIGGHSGAPRLTPATQTTQCQWCAQTVRVLTVGPYMQIAEHERRGSTCPGTGIIVGRVTR